MPRKPQFSTEDIIDTAFALAREQEHQGLSAPAIAEVSQCSTIPIYSHFNLLKTLWLRSSISDVKNYSP